MHGYSEITLQHNLLAFAENSVISSIVLMNLAIIDDYFISILFNRENPMW